MSVAIWNLPCSSIQLVGESVLWPDEPRAWRRVFARCDKCNMMFVAFITVALIAESPR